MVELEIVSIATVMTIQCIKEGNNNIEELYSLFLHHLFQLPQTEPKGQVVWRWDIITEYGYVLTLRYNNECLKKADNLCNNLCFA